MTPTAQIAAIRQRAEIAKEYGASSVAWSQDIPFLLQQIDIHQSALRALVAQLDEYDRIDQCSPATPWCDAPSYVNSDHYDGHAEPKRQRIKAIRDAVDRLLSGPQP